MLWTSIGLLIAAVVLYLVFYIGRTRLLMRRAKGEDVNRRFRIYTFLCVAATVLAVAGLVIFIIAGSDWGQL